MTTRATQTGLVLAALGLGFSTPLGAQETIQLRYHPHQRMVVRTVSWTDMEIKLALGGLMSFMVALGEGMAEAFGGDTADVSAIRDSMEAAMAELGDDSIRIEVALEQHLTDLVLEAEPGRYLVYRTMDSARVRTRAEGEAWEEGSLNEVTRASARLVLDKQLTISAFELVTPDTVDQRIQALLRAPHGGYELTLPAGPVSPGATWSTEVSYPFDMGPGMEQQGPAIEGQELVAQANITLDSIVPRDRDTLAYLSMWGDFIPQTSAEENEFGRSTTTIEGSFAGVLVWSTAWNAFVSGASRAVMTADIRLGAPDEEEEGGGVGMGMRLNITNRFQVRP